jgi:hypothetical protein
VERRELQDEPSWVLYTSFKSSPQCFLIQNLVLPSSKENSIIAKIYLQLIYSQRTNKIYSSQAAIFFCCKYLPFGNKIKFHTTHTKDFGEKNAPKLPDFKDFFL